MVCGWQSGRPAQVEALAVAHTKGDEGIQLGLLLDALSHDVGT